MQRVLIIGCSGAGKTTLARRLALFLGLPIVHLDRYFWRAGWQQPSSAEWEEQVRALAAKPQWVMDGNYSSTLPMRLRVADTVIVLDAPRWLCLTGVLRRLLLHYGRVRGDELPDGCPERFDWAFLRYTWRYRDDHRPRAMKALEAFKGDVIVLRSAAEAARYMESLARPALGGDVIAS